MANRFMTSGKLFLKPNITPEFIGEDIPTVIGDSSFDSGGIFPKTLDTNVVPKRPGRQSAKRAGGSGSVTPLGPQFVAARPQAAVVSAEPRDSVPEEPPMPPRPQKPAVVHPSPERVRPLVPPAGAYRSNKPSAPPNVPKRPLLRSFGPWILAALSLLAVGYMLHSAKPVIEQEQPFLPVPAPRPPQAKPYRATPTPAHSLVAKVARATETSILRTLTLAATADKSAIEAAALGAGRDFDFSTFDIKRSRKGARPLNAAALDAFHREQDFRKAYGLQKDAFAADPLDIEIAGNLAIYAFRADKIEEAREYILYALGLPRSSEKTGRTADWATLAAVYARNGDAVNAQNALFVTLAISSNVAKRCEVAVSSVNETYGPILRQATEAMFMRIREQQLSDAPECALPIQWK